MKKISFSAILSLMVFLLALVLVIVRWSVESFNFGSHPAFMFFFALALGLAIVQTVYAVKNKSPFRFMIAGICCAYALCYFFADVVILPVFIIVIIGVAVALTYATASIALCGNRTESISKNAQPDYKDYKQREEEKKNAPKEEEKPLPEIKSFK